MLCFNNGRQPDRHWSSVDEWKMPPIIPAADGGAGTEQGAIVADPEPATLVWSFGPKFEHFGRFFSTHISGCQRLPNGNTLITQGPEGIVFEVTSEGQEVWRFINPMVGMEGALGRIRQGDNRGAATANGGRVGMFRCNRYPTEYPAFAGKQLEEAQRADSLPFLTA